LHVETELCDRIDEALKLGVATSRAEFLRLAASRLLETLSASRALGNPNQTSLNRLSAAFQTESNRLPPLERKRREFFQQDEAAYKTKQKKSRD
jgi:hypothetical protein